MIFAWDSCVRYDLGCVASGCGELISCMLMNSQQHHADCVLCSPSRQVNTQEFEEAIQDCSTPIIVDIFAVWCGPVSAQLY